ncbi:MAG: DUF1330 domain-containing protein [Rhizobiaceae bacterium]
MAKGYWIGRVDVTDQDAYMKYVHGNAEAINKYGGRFLVRGGQFENPEGNARARNVVLEFDSYQQALDCYNSPEYQAVIPLRATEGVSQGDFVIIEGYDPA